MKVVHGKGRNNVLIMVVTARDDPQQLQKEIVVRMKVVCKKKVQQ
jgi:hypothetical protein